MVATSSALNLLVHTEVALNCAGFSDGAITFNHEQDYNLIPGFQVFKVLLYYGNIDKMDRRIFAAFA